MRRDRVAAVVIAVVAGGCTTGIKELRQEVASLRDRVDEMSRTASAVRARIDDMEGRLLLIQDEVETQRIASMRGGRGAVLPPPSLPVVKVTPPEEAAAPPAVGPGRPTSIHEPGYQEIDEFGRVVPGSGGGTVRDEAPPKPRPKVAGRPVAAEPDASGRIAEYQAAYALYEQGRVQEAMKALAAFVARNPKHAYADNAQYWIGECYYDLKDWAAAKREFMRVVTEHPDGNKVPDAMVKVGLCARALRQDDEARTMFDAVMLTYPESAAAGVALKLLGEMQ